MAHTYSQMYFHFVWSTKNRERWIDKEIAAGLYAYIKGIVENHKFTLLAIGGIEDHIHLFVRPTPSINSPLFVKAIKVASTTWLKSNNPKYLGFAWQEGYGLFTVSPNLKDVAVNYIENQEEHHKHAAVPADHFFRVR